MISFFAQKFFIKKIEIFTENSKKKHNKFSYDLFHKVFLSSTKLKFAGILKKNNVFWKKNSVTKKIYKSLRRKSNLPQTFNKSRL